MQQRGVPAGGKPAPDAHQRGGIEGVADQHQNRYVENRDADAQDRNQERRDALLHRYRLELLGVVVLVERDGPHQQHQKCNGHRRGDRPVPIAEELVPEHPADHQVVGSAEDGGDDEFADRRNEHQHGTGNDARNRLRQGHVEEGPPGRAAQVAGRFQQGMIQLLERRVQRQDHERQVGVDDPQVHGHGGVHDVQRMVDDAQPQQRGVEQAGLPDDSFERVNAQQERGPERQDDDEQQNALRALGRAREPQSHGIAQQQADDGREKSRLERIQVGNAIDVVGEQIAEITEVQRQMDVPVGTDG